LKRQIGLVAALLLGLWLSAEPVVAQDLEPRRWSHLPTGINFIGLGLAYTEGEIFVDPVLEIEDAEVDMFITAVSYVHSFGLFGRSARFDVTVPFADGRWDGLLQGEPAGVSRHGLKDPRFRLSVLLYGGDAMDRKTFAQTKRSNTVVGAGLSVIAPLGEYFDDRLINLGDNRWIIRPQLGVTHTRGKWTYELTGSVFFFTENDAFFQGAKLKNDPLYALQGHLIYTFRPGLWASLSTGYGDGAEPTIDGVPRDATTENWLTALSFGLPISRSQGLKFTYLRSRTQVPNGADLDTILIGYSKMF
jgi:hypothetical protein